jgi:hypothetical protein
MIEQDLARIASALEQIAQVMAHPSQIAVGNLQQVATETKPLPTDIDSQAAPTGNADDADHLTRENLKRDLRALGVPFKDSARTSTLQKLLDDKLAALPHSETEDAPKDATPQETEEPMNDTPVTRDDVRMALIELSAAKGKDAALAMLRKVGGAEKLSDVAEDRYAAIVKACKERCDG